MSGSDLLKNSQLLYMYASAYNDMVDPYRQLKREHKQLTPAEKEVKQKDIKLKNGMKLFNIEGVEIYAINYKNALKKYNKTK